MGGVKAKIYHQGPVEAEPYDCQLERGLEMTEQNALYGTFEKLLKKAEELVVSSASVQQAIAVLTSGGRIFCCVNHDIVAGNYADETAFMKTLAENKDTEIRYSVCMWSDFTLDIPSWHLRDLLVKLNPSNRKAEFLLRGGEGFVVRALEDMHGV